MAQQTRMVATLVVLVVSMCGTSVVLSWLDPSLPEGFNSLASNQIVSLARVAVTQDVVVDTRLWHEIEVAPVRSPSRSTLLSAIANKPRSNHTGSEQTQEQGNLEDPSPWHFRIAPDGRPIRGTCWRDQQEIESAPDAIRIELGAASSSGASITSSQWFCLRVLVAAINESAQRGGEPLTVVIGGQADRLTRQLLEAKLH